MRRRSHDQPRDQGLRPDSTSSPIWIDTSASSSASSLRAQDVVSGPASPVPNSSGTKTVRWYTWLVGISAWLGISTSSSRHSPIIAPHVTSSSPSLTVACLKVPAEHSSEATDQAAAARSMTPSASLQLVAAPNEAAKISRKIICSPMSHHARHGIPQQGQAADQAASTSSRRRPSCQHLD